MVSGLYLFENLSFLVVLTFRTALKDPLSQRANIVSIESNVEHAEDNVLDLRFKEIPREWLLTLLSKRRKGKSQFIHGLSANPDVVCLGEIEIRGFLCIIMKDFYGASQISFCYFGHPC